MTLLVSVDPGKDTGIALWSDGKLAHVWSEDVPKIPVYSPAIPTEAGRADVCVCEVPRWYAERSLADANDLIVLAVRVGMLVQRVGARETRFVAPSDWKGQMPKDVCARKIRGILSPEENATLSRCLAVVPRGAQHNLTDAVGIGLHAQGRFGR